MLVNSILVIEVIDRDVRQVIPCKTQNEAIAKANELLKYRCADVGYLNEFEAGKDMLEKWDNATNDNLRAWCNYDGEHWDAHIAILDADGQALECVRNARVFATHKCKYCGAEVEGSDADILCNECACTFGHYRYSQLRGGRNGC